MITGLNSDTLMALIANNRTTLIEVQNVEGDIKDTAENVRKQLECCLSPVNYTVEFLVVKQPTTKAETQSLCDKLCQLNSISEEFPIITIVLMDVLLETRDILGISMSGSVVNHVEVAAVYNQTHIYINKMRRNLLSNLPIVLSFEDTSIYKSVYLRRGYNTIMTVIPLSIANFKHYRDTLLAMFKGLAEEEVKVAVENGDNPPFNLELLDFESDVDLYSYNSYLLYADNVCVGCASYIPLDYEVSNFYINPEHRGKGYGRFFMQWMINNLDVREVGLVPSNKPAMTLYESLGFKPKHLVMTLK